MPSSRLGRQSRERGSRSRFVTTRSFAAAVSLILLACESGSTEPSTVRTGGTIPSLGTNLDAFSYWTSAQPFLNLFKASTGFRAPGPWTARGYVPDLDADGWVKSVPTDKESWEGLQFEMLVEAGAPPRRRYVVLFEGQGTLQPWHDTRLLSAAPDRLLVESGTKGDIRLTLTATDPARTGNYLRNIRVVQEEYLPLLEAGLSFNPDWLAKVQDLHTLRFMDWTATNRMFDSRGREVTANHAAAPLVGWSSRPKAAEATWDRGAPVELLVELANRTGTDMWVNMPVNANDDYVRNFATYVRENLRPDLKVHVELSNEIWNSMFVQTRYADARGKSVFGSSSGFGEWKGVRTAQIGQIWNRVFGEPATGDNPGRAIIVLATQAGWHGLEGSSLETPNWRGSDGRHIRAADFFDEYAITGYYYGTAGSRDAEAQLLQWSRDPRGVEKALAAIGAELDGTLAGHYRYHAGVAAKYGLRLVAYEAGPHINTPASMHDNVALTDWLIALNRRPEFYRFEQRNYANFRKAGGTLFLNYGIISAPNKHGSWGALERVDQKGSPRYDALLDYSRAHDPWWERGRDAATFGNARISMASNSGETLAGSARGFDVLVGGAGDDTFNAGGGSLTVDGSAGNDTLNLPGSESQYREQPQRDGFRELRRGSVSVRFRNIEKLTYSAG